MSNSLQKVKFCKEYQPFGTKIRLYIYTANYT